MGKIQFFIYPSLILNEIIGPDLTARVKLSLGSAGGSTPNWRANPSRPQGLNHRMHRKVADKC
jgi:hypothetical protein